MRSAFLGGVVPGHRHIVRVPTDREDAISTPSITPAQIIAAIGAIVTELLNDQLVDGHMAKLITGLAGILVPFAWMLADAWIRHGRAKAHAAITIAAGAQAAAGPKRTTRSGH